MRRVGSTTIASYKANGMTGRLMGAGASQTWQTLT